MDNEHWSLEEVNEKLKEKILLAYKKVKELSEKENLSLKKAAYKIAAKRIIGAEKV